jgi:ribA/ribD-fused uncharacterized protein
MKPKLNAKPKMIVEFKDEYAFLSNFYESKGQIVIPKNYNYLDKEYWGINLPSVEHFYQGMKTLDAKERQMIFLASTPGKAKRLGRKVKMRPNWDDMKVIFMFEGLMMKFNQNPELKKKLKNTGSVILIEGNDWGDMFWGKDIKSLDDEYIGLNILGKLLMCIRGI